MTKEQAEYVKQLRCLGCTYRAIARHYGRKFPDTTEIGDNQLYGEWLVVEAAQILDESDHAWDDAGVAIVGYDVEKQMSEAEILRKFTREMMGSTVAHMTDEQLDAWMEPWRKLVDNVEPGFPLWFVKKRNEQRCRLLAVLMARPEERR